MVPWLCVPLIHLLLARNWNLAISLLPLTASRVANNVAVSTPLRMGLSVVVDISLLVSYRLARAVSCGDRKEHAFPGPSRRAGPRMWGRRREVRSRRLSA